jgi:hypothetical protein
MVSTPFPVLVSVVLCWVFDPTKSVPKDSELGDKDTTGADRV